jgi:hypothetical protein
VVLPMECDSLSMHARHAREQHEIRPSRALELCSVHVPRPRRPVVHSDASTCTWVPHDSLDARNTDVAVSALLWNCVCQSCWTWYSLSAEGSQSGRVSDMHRPVLPGVRVVAIEPPALLRLRAFSIDIHLDSRIDWSGNMYVYSDYSMEKSDASVAEPGLLQRMRALIAHVDR